MREREYVLSHPDLEGTGRCLESALPVWLERGYTVVAVADLARTPAATEPLWIEVNGEMVPANDAARAEAAAPEPEWTGQRASKKEAKAADASEETD